MKRKFLAFVNRRYVHAAGSPVVCGAEDLATTDFSVCAPKTALSEIGRIFLCKVGGAPFADVSQAAEWELRMSETETGIDAIRPLTVIADKPAPAKTEKEISNRRKIISQKEHTINFTIDEVTDTNHAFIQSIENGKTYRGWYETAGGYMFGGNGGIFWRIQGDMILARGSGELATYAGTLTWFSDATEDRCLSPIFGETILGQESFDTAISFANDATPNNSTNDFSLAGGVNAVAKFEYNDMSPTNGTPIAMTIKIATVLKLTCNMDADYVGMPFRFTSTAGIEYTGFIVDGDRNF